MRVVDSTFRCHMVSYLFVATRGHHGRWGGFLKWGNPHIIHFLGIETHGVGDPPFSEPSTYYIYTICVCVFEKCFKEGKATEMVPWDAIICQKNSRTGSLGHSWYGLIRGASHVPHLGRSDVSPFWWKLTLSGVLHLQKIESFHCQFSCWRVPNIYIYISRIRAYPLLTKVLWVTGGRQLPYLSSEQSEHIFFS